MEVKMNRRNFLAGVVASAATKGLGADAPSADDVRDQIAPFKIGAPVLQVPAETSMGVVWAVNRLATGCVEVADNSRMENSWTVRPGGLGLVAFNDLALQVRLTGLKPATRYWYRTRTREFLDYTDAYHATLGAEIAGDVHSFTTLGAKCASHFCVMNDTHAEWGQFKLVTDKILALAPTAMLWNGDATNSTEDAATATEIFLTPPETRTDYAADIPILFNNGNHDFRGRWMPRLNEILMERLPDERTSRDWDLRRNFAVRIGDIALIGLDTGEDKPDCHEKWFGLANYSPYRRAQALWLADQFKRPEIADASFVVASCHIPLFDADPTADPGLVAHPDKWAEWHKECADLWGPVLSANRVQLVIAAHTHRYRYDAPTADRPWAQIVAGGRSSSASGRAFPTVLDVKPEEGEMKVSVHNVLSGRIVAEHRFRPRV